MAMNSAIFWEVEHEGEPIDYLTPSRLARAVRCPWSVIRTSAPLLPSGPESVLGSVLHDVVERARQQRLEPGSDTKKALEATFMHLLERAQERLEAEDRGHLVPLRRCIPWRTWTERKTACFALALEAYTSKTSKNDQGERDDDTLHAFTRMEHVPHGERAEVSLAARRGMLTGRIDLLVRHGQDIELIDFKTGRIHDAHGVLHDHITWQMRGYAALVDELVEDARIRLVVRGRQGEHAWTYDESERVMTRQTLERLEARIVNHEDSLTLTSDSLAHPGPACARCPKRYVCPAYLEVAPKWWHDAPEFAIPHDVWGVMSEVIDHGTHMTLEVKLGDGRCRRVCGLSHDVLPDGTTLIEGEHIGLFGLAARRHGDTLHELPSTPSHRRAWETHVVTSNHVE